MRAVTVENSVGALAYSLYAQGLSLREISQALEIRKGQASYHIKKYARDACAPYPLPRKSYNGEYLFNLYQNGMSTRAISQLVGVHKDKVYSRIRGYAQSRGFADPFQNLKAKKALELRETTDLTYAEIAVKTGYSDRVACYKGVQREKKRRDK
jgi:transposase